MQIQSIRTTLIVLTPLSSTERTSSSWEVKYRMLKNAMMRRNASVLKSPLLKQTLRINSLMQDCIIQPQNLYYVHKGKLRLNLAQISPPFITTTSLPCSTALIDTATLKEDANKAISHTSLPLVIASIPFFFRVGYISWELVWRLWCSSGSTAPCGIFLP